MSKLSREGRKQKTVVAKSIIRRYYPSLITSIPVDDVLPLLYSKGVVTEYEKQEITSKPTSYKKAESLLDSLLKKSFQEFEIFCEVLRSFPVHVLQEKAKDLFHQGLLKKSIAVEKKKQYSGDQGELLERIEGLKAGSTELIINRLHASGSFQHLSWHEVLSKLREIKILTDDEESILNNPLAVPSLKENALVRCLVRNGPIHGLRKFCQILIETQEQQAAHTLILDSLRDEVQIIDQGLSPNPLPDPVREGPKKKGFLSQPSHHEPSTGAPMKAVGSGTEPTPKLPSPQSVPSQHNPKHVLEIYMDSSRPLFLGLQL